MSKTKEEILNAKIMENNMMWVSNAFSKGSERTDVYKIAISAMSLYSDQQNASLLAEVEILRKGLNDILEHLKLDDMGIDMIAADALNNIASQALNK